MYQPAHFIEDDLSVLHALIREFPLGLLITIEDGLPVANAIPFLIYDNDGKGLLRCHVARANPQWQHLKDGAKALVVFQGPQAYVTPSWYAAKKEHGKVVPTWNYAMVQVRGSATIHDDADWLQAQITALTQTHEGSRRAPWAVSDAPERYIEMQKRAIVGIEIVIEDIRGKWKVSQNRSDADIAGVAEGYETGGDSAMAEIVRNYGKI